MERPTISVMMPCYNNSKYILEAMHSVLSQSWRDFELVIVDDASIDGSPALVESCDDARVRLVRNERNRGIAAVRNQLLSLARGQYLTSLDGDDLYRSPEKLASELALMPPAGTSKQTSIVYSDIQWIDASGEVIGRASESTPPREGILFQALLNRTIMIPRDFLVPAELAKGVGGFDENLAIYEDWDYKLRLAQRGRFVYTHRVGIGYRRHGGGLSSASKPLHRHCRELIRRKHGIHGFERDSMNWLRKMMRPARLHAQTKAA